MLNRQAAAAAEGAAAAAASAWPLRAGEGSPW
jgi:hypothetical protein